MQREGASASLHRRVAAALARGARAQEESRTLVDATRSLQARLTNTRAAVRAQRAKRPPARHGD